MKNRKFDIQAKLFRFLLSFYLYRVATKIWLENQDDIYMSTQDIQCLLDAAWPKYGMSVIDMEKQGNLGNWLVMNFAYLTLSAYQVMLADGINQDEAIDKIHAITWDITSTWTKRAKRLSKFLFQDQMNQLNFFVGFIMKTLFSPPGYDYKRGKFEDGFYLDVKQCPVAELMISNGASGLCIQTWCGVDFGLVEILGGTLQRKGTLAMGERKCDFVFHSHSWETSPQQNGL